MSRPTSGLRVAIVAPTLEILGGHSVQAAALLAGWLVSAQFGSIGYYWTLYYVVALGVAAHEIVVRRQAWARGGIARGGAPA